MKWSTFEVLYLYRLTCTKQNESLTQGVNKPRIRLIRGNYIAKPAAEL